MLLYWIQVLWTIDYGAQVTQPENLTVDDYQRILTETPPLMDVRAPVEFTKGSIPGSVNLPLMDDEQRHQVGICYKQHGQQAALELGHRLVSGETRAKRTEAWLSFIAEHPDAALFCSRGGLRSQITQEWILEASGKSIPRIEGGYKAIRNRIINLLHPDSLTNAPVMLGGRTGCGKTILLHHLANSIDLEGLANHRGSSFGCFIDPQPGQADFENHLARELVRHARAAHTTIVFENEGTHVGRCYLPRELAEFFQTCPLVMLEMPLETRVMTIFDEYVIDGQAAHVQRFGRQQGMISWLATMLQSVERIANRLGRERADTTRHSLQKAHERQLQTGKADGHTTWIELLLSNYYDPMYDYNFRKNQRKVIFSGDFDSVLSFLREYEQTDSCSRFAM